MAKAKYNTWGFIGAAPFDFKDKKDAVSLHVTQMLNRTQSMFKYTGLPDTIPQRVLELYLQTNGNVCFYQYNGELYVYTGGMGGVPNEYYMPTVYTIANPYQKLTVMAEINKDCIVIPNDSCYLGLMPLCTKYATLLAENEISIRMGIINSRAPNLFSAADDTTKASVEKVLKGIEDGTLGVIGDKSIFEDITSLKMIPNAKDTNNSLTNLIEMEQYLKASWFNEIGLNANWNAKRESINSNESQLNDDMLLPLVDDMLRCRKIGVEKVNDMFGTNISVEFNSAWEDNVIETDLAQEALDQNNNNVEEVDSIETESDDSAMDDK